MYSYFRYTFTFIQSNRNLHMLYTIAMPDNDKIATSLRTHIHSHHAHLFPAIVNQDNHHQVSAALKCCS